MKSRSVLFSFYVYQHRGQQLGRLEFGDGGRDANPTLTWHGQTNRPVGAQASHVPTP